MLLLQADALTVPIWMGTQWLTDELFSCTRTSAIAQIRLSYSGVLRRNTVCEQTFSCYTFRLSHSSGYDRRLLSNFAIEGARMMLRRTHLQGEGRCLLVYGLVYPVRQCNDQGSHSQHAEPLSLT